MLSYWARSGASALPQAEDAHLPWRRGDGFLFFFPPPPLLFFLRSGILKQAATKANSQDTGLHSLHDVRFEEDNASPFSLHDSVSGPGLLGNHSLEAPFTAHSGWAAHQSPGLAVALSLQRLTWAVLRSPLLDGPAGLTAGQLVLLGRNITFCCSVQAPKMSVLDNGPFVPTH